ncbi:MAG: hypothetical protein AB4368_14685 [Xenococcaceae cyanobacterium]
MTNSTLSPQEQFDRDEAIWSSLKQAIEKSSGFKRWQNEQNLEIDGEQNSDIQIQKYLRETLETLAY